MNNISHYPHDMSISVRVEQSTWDFYDDVWCAMDDKAREQFEMSKSILGMNFSNPAMRDNHAKFVASLGYVIH